MRAWLLAKALSSLMKLAVTLISDSLCFLVLTEITIFFYSIFIIDFFPLISRYNICPNVCSASENSQSSSGCTTAPWCTPNVYASRLIEKKSQNTKNPWALEMHNLGKCPFHYDCLWNCIGYKLSQQVSLNLFYVSARKIKLLKPKNSFAKIRGNSQGCF